MRRSWPSGGNSSVDPDLIGHLAEMAMFPATADKSLVEWIAADMSSAPKEIALAAMVSVFSNIREMPATLAELKLPTIAFNADHPPTDVESLKRHGVEVVLMPGVGHFPMMEDPERFNRVLGSVIEKLR